MRLICPVLPLIIHALFISLFFIVCAALCASASKHEGDALKILVASADLEGKVIKQWDGDNPCGESAWPGVKCDGADALNVTSLVLDNMNLTGFIPEGTLGKLKELRILSLSDNGLTGQIPSDLINCANLKHLYMSNNAFSGPIPSPLSRRLKRIFLDSNRLSGSIPNSMSDMDGLLSLFLENNMLEGGIPPLSQQNLVELNVSYNNLSGEIPSSISSRNFSSSGFMGNPELCGFPLKLCATSQLTEQKNVTDSANGQQKAGKKQLATGTIVAIVIGSLAFFLLFTLFFLWYNRKRPLHVTNKDMNQNMMKKAKKQVVPSERDDFQSMSAISMSDEDKPQLVFFEEMHSFRLEDLLRASAELLGKGSLGSAYKAMMEDGRMLCVRRLKELNHVTRKQFEQQMQLVGMLRHPNVVPLWAYYYAKEEKLLVYEYQPNGNLLNLLQAGQQKQVTGHEAVKIKPLSWNARLRIAKGIANGLAYLHNERGSQNIAHGNIKASNILIGKDYEARIADFGLAQFVDMSALTQKGDVYSFGVLLLELLTGRVTQDTSIDEDMLYGSPSFNLPQWVTSVVKEEWSAEVFDRTLFNASISSEESLISMLKIAMACTSKSPDQRPHMARVLRMIADIHEDVDNSISTSMSLDQVQFQFTSSDNSALVSTKNPFCMDEDASFGF